uniref:Uncharacterized protein n=1 Tax=Onchocerca volvulus TaxID=6282 RepID=A0A8R1TX86_ONCVO
MFVADIIRGHLAQQVLLKCIKDTGDRGNIGRQTSQEHTFNTSPNVNSHFWKMSNESGR